jgi:hypothetical protein
MRERQVPIRALHLRNDAMHDAGAARIVSETVVSIYLHSSTLARRPYIAHARTFKEIFRRDGTVLSY